MCSTKLRYLLPIALNRSATSPLDGGLLAQVVQAAQIVFGLPVLLCGPLSQN